MGSPNSNIVQQCPSEPKPHWIEIELIAEDDQPVPWERYEVTLPNGSVRQGFLGSDGRARIDNIQDAGQCRVTFPDLDAAAWDWA